MPLRVIPVIDLKGGQVVHARQGLRDGYLPIVSPLCASSDFFRVLETFFTLYPFDIVYIADLDALTGSGSHEEWLDAAMRAYPRIEFWIDRGFVSSSELNCKPANYWPVLGSEALSDALLPDLVDFGHRFIISLDFFGERRLGPQVLFDTARHWPEKVIIMTLGRVGGEQGPDYRRLENYVRSHPYKKFVAAGGVRDRGDLLRLERLGIEYALAASALHAKAVGADDIHSLSVS